MFATNMILSYDIHFIKTKQILWDRSRNSHLMTNILVLLFLEICLGQGDIFAISNLLITNNFCIDVSINNYTLLITLFWA